MGWPPVAPKCSDASPCAKSQCGSRANAPPSRRQQLEWLAIGENQDCEQCEADDPPTQLPSHRVQTAIGLSGLAVAVLAFLLGALALALYATTGLSCWRLGLYGLRYATLWVGGLVYAVREVHKETRVESVFAELARASRPTA